MQNSNLKTLEAQRAYYAYKFAQEADSIFHEKKAIATYGSQAPNNYYHDPNYKSYVKKIPTWIKTNGLGAAFAFIMSSRTTQTKGKAIGSETNCKNAYDLIYEQIAFYIKKERSYLLNKEHEQADLMLAITQLNSADYRAITIEILALSTWLIRLTDGIIQYEKPSKK